MGRRVGIPYFGNPPQQYEQRYLETGTLFEWDGFVKVAKTDAPHLASTEITSATGSVGVTIA